MGDIEDFEDDVSILELHRKRKKEESEDDERNEEDKLREIQKLKASMHFHTAKLAEGESEKSGITISNETVAALADIAFNFAESVGHDLFYFAQHAKRHTVQPEDVRLCARKSENLYAIMTENMNALANDAEERKNSRKSKNQDDTTVKKKPGRPKKVKVNDDEEDDEDSKLQTKKQIQANDDNENNNNNSNNNNAKKNLKKPQTNYASEDDEIFKNQSKPGKNNSSTTATKSKKAPAQGSKVNPKNKIAQDVFVPNSDED